MGSLFIIQLAVHAEFAPTDIIKTAKMERRGLPEVAGSDVIVIVMGLDAMTFLTSVLMYSSSSTSGVKGTPLQKGCLNKNPASFLPSYINLAVLETLCVPISSSSEWR